MFTSPESGSAKGIEFLISIRQIPFLPKRPSSLGLGYALSKAEVETETGSIPRDFDRRHSLSLSADYALWADGWLNVAWRFHSGDPYTKAWYEKTISESGEEVSTREIKKILQECISNEEKRKPLTDDKLAAILQEKGYQIARRTVAKYREQLNLPVARLRKEL